MQELANTPEINNDLESVSVRLAETPEELEAAQRLRYEVFYNEYGAIPNKEMSQNAKDFDEYDEYADHLIVIDEEAPKDNRIIGTYRLLQRNAATKVGQFYSESEYDLGPLLRSEKKLLELGRSCVLAPYRNRPVLQLLWQGIADYISEHDIDLMFGCASLHSTDIKSISAPLSYLYHYHLAPETIRPRAVKGRYINMNIIPQEDINARRVFAELPPLIKGYLRVGASIGDGAVIDEQFNTTDVFIVVQTHLLTDRYRKHYERKIQKSMPGTEKSENEDNVTPLRTAASKTGA
ncbi:MAG: GNAT family N-acetyltransferase [Alphaproteobacteria bacterium]|nr:GNAT family N-acetyltransferase [Alphaproteobacteria bacterium]